MGSSKKEKFSKAMLFILLFGIVSLFSDMTLQEFYQFCLFVF